MSHQFSLQQQDAGNRPKREDAGRYFRPGATKMKKLIVQATIAITTPARNPIEKYRQPSAKWMSIQATACWSVVTGIS
jgi:hypothetical protein